MKKLFIAVAATAMILFSGCQTELPFGLDDAWKNHFSQEEAHVKETVFIHGQVTERTFKDFYDNTSTGADEYRVIINTDGGEAMACLGIMSRIKELQLEGVKIDTEVYSKAYSAGFFIWLMGQERIMHEGATLMVHTMRAQAEYTYKRAAEDLIPLERYRLFELLDEKVVELAMTVLKDIPCPETLRTALLYTGMTWVSAQEAYELEWATQYIPIFK